MFFRIGTRVHTIKPQVRRFRKLEPMRLLAGSVALVFALLVAGYAVGAAAGAFNWQAAVSVGVAVLIVAGGLLYAFRLGAGGRAD